VVVEVKVPGFAGAPAPGVKTHVTPAFVVSLGTTAVIVTVPPAMTWRALAVRTTVL